MTAPDLNVIDQYVRKVMRLIHAPQAERARIQADLKGHLQEGAVEGDNMTSLVERMGDPREVAADFMAEIPQVYADFWLRLAAFVLDAVVIALLTIVAGFVLVSVSNALIPDHPATPLEKIVGGFFILMYLNGAIALVLIILAYFPVLEARFGQTLGKHLFHLRVCAENGLPVTLWQAFVRRLSFYFEVFPVDALFIFFKPKKQRGFDILAHTVVVKE